MHVVPLDRRVGAQHVALNMGNPKPDLPLQLHYALFEDSGGYVLKPKEMLQKTLQVTETVTSYRIGYDCAIELQQKLEAAM